MLQRELADLALGGPSLAGHDGGDGRVVELDPLELRQDRLLPHFVAEAGPLTRRPQTHSMSPGWSSRDPGIRERRSAELGTGEAPAVRGADLTLWATVNHVVNLRWQPWMT